MTIWAHQASCQEGAVTVRKIQSAANIRPSASASGRRSALDDGRRSAADPARRRELRGRRRRVGVLALVTVAATLIGVDLLRAGADAEGRLPAAVREPGPGGAADAEAPDSGTPDGAAALPPLIAPAPSGTPDPDASDSADAPGDDSPGDADGPGNADAPGARGGPQAPPASYPQAGTGTFGYLTGSGPVLGWAGELRRFRIAVEDGIGQRADEFAGIVDATLGDQRSWVASRQFRLQRVSRADAAEFTIYLASPATSERMCALGGLSTEQYTSCRLPGQVIINVARWLEAVPHFDAPLAEYRAYAINHEVGHQFGMFHEVCPAPGRPAPVMQQQTYGMQGCVANGWPYLDGKRYTGPPMV
ncbi:DUF3152 domain-containing protein [Solwaraspora sp. WMMD791]|uniref:DUF3152 domain-containing protein n=1 Tax=Solwaraspora sp. WMMD791 TaxID=3016086 RepID=UPI00249CCB2F|nr:DUF3152 domain-containing protein [Solwaraspora sp. WMMD791]WFE25187.1 DUF3152 domain-containing protein [Solwaraspora sp. WMMD791]